MKTAIERRKRRRKIRNDCRVSQRCWDSYMPLRPCLMHSIMVLTRDGYHYSEAEGLALGIVSITI